MTDLEMLEMAAKAAELPVNFEVEGGIGWFACGEDENGNVEAWWNPLKDDGDSLRLAVKLQIIFGKYDHYASAGHIGSGIDVVVWSHVEPDPYAATRRAITRTAAEIWNNMPKGEK